MSRQRESAPARVEYLVTEETEARREVDPEFAALLAEPVSTVFDYAEPEPEPVRICPICGDPDCRS